MPRFGRTQKRGFAAAAASSRIGMRISKTGPSQLRTNIEVSHQYRFTSSSATATQILASTLLPACGVVATSATAGFCMFQSVKVNRIEIWSPPASQGVFATCSVLFPAANQSQAREITDTTVSVSVPAHVLTSPPERSLCAFWTNGFQENAANEEPLFTLVAPSGSIIDVWVSLVLGDGTSAAAVNNEAVLVGATVGSVYYTSLDSSTSAGSIYKPVGLTTA